MALYLYGVGYCSLAPPEEITAVAPSSGGCRVVVDRDLGALVTELVADGTVSKPAATAANLAAHERIVDAVGRSEAFVPARFGVVVDNESDLVTRLLRAKRTALVRTLGQLSNRVEMRLTVTFEGDDLLREAVERSPRVARLRRRVGGRSAAASYYDRIALGEAVREEVLWLQQRELEALRARLGVAVVEHKVLAGPDGTTARVAYLVNVGDLPRFDGELEGFADDRDGRMRFELLGPLAPWDFTDLGEPDEAVPIAARGRRRAEGRGAVSR